MTKQRIAVAPAILRFFLGAALATALMAAGRDSGAVAMPLDALGLLAMPEEGVAPLPSGVVVALHEPTGIDARGWAYGDQLAAAGIAVLHVELTEATGDDRAPDAGAAGTMAALARLTLILDHLATDPRVAGVPVGLLAFGAAGDLAARAAAQGPAGDRVAALALLYPGCADLADALARDQARLRAWGGLRILLLHGDADPANTPADCGRLEAELASAAPVLRRHYAGAGYAWDLPPHGPYEAVKLAWPGRPGALLPVIHSPAAAAVSAAHVASFFTLALAP